MSEIQDKARKKILYANLILNKLESASKLGMSGLVHECNKLRTRVDGYISILSLHLEGQEFPNPFTEDRRPYTTEELVELLEKQSDDGKEFLMDTVDLIESYAKAMRL